MCLLSGTCDTQFYVNMTNILGVLISGLSVSVVILLGWEITSFVRFKKRVGMDISKAVDNMNNRIESEISKLNKISEAKYLNGIGISQYSSGNYIESLLSFRASLQISIDINSKKDISDSMFFINKYVEKNIDINIEEDDINDLITIISKVDDKNKAEIIRYFANINSKKAKQKEG